MDVTIRSEDFVKMIGGGSMAEEEVSGPGSVPPQKPQQMTPARRCLYQPCKPCHAMDPAETSWRKEASFQLTASDCGVSSITFRPSGG